MGTNIVEEHVMDIFKKSMREDSVEDIGAIVDFEEEEDDSDPETCDLVNSLNQAINIQTSQAGLDNESNKALDTTDNDDNVHKLNEIEENMINGLNIDDIRHKTDP